MGRGLGATGWKSSLQLVETGPLGTGETLGCILSVMFLGRPDVGILAMGNVREGYAATPPCPMGVGGFKGAGVERELPVPVGGRPRYWGT